MVTTRLQIVWEAAGLCIVNMAFSLNFICFCISFTTRRSFQPAWQSQNYPCFATACCAYFERTCLNKYKKIQSSLANFYLQFPLLTFFFKLFFNIFVKILSREEIFVRTRIHASTLIKSFTRAFMQKLNLHNSTWLRSFSMKPALKLQVQTLEPSQYS